MVLDHSGTASRVGHFCTKPAAKREAGGQAGRQKRGGGYPQHVDVVTVDEAGMASTSCPPPHSLGPDSDCQPMSKDHFRFRIPRSLVTVTLKSNSAMGAKAKSLMEHPPTQRQPPLGSSLPLPSASSWSIRLPGCRKVEMLPCPGNLRVRFLSLLLSALLPLTITEAKVLPLAITSRFVLLFFLGTHPTVCGQLLPGPLPAPAG